jgi:anaerobic selenocysteine-containing dehydrogenase
MHVLIADGYRPRLRRPLHRRLRASSRSGRRVDAGATAQTCGISAGEVSGLARDYGTIKPAAIRCQLRHAAVAGGGNAVRAIACLPALVGAWRDPAGGACCRRRAPIPIERSALERPDLIRAGRARST